jgi:hypothetical protein
MVKNLSWLTALAAAAVVFAANPPGAAVTPPPEVAATDDAEPDAVTTNALPAAPPHPYQAIMTRNSFGLKDPPPPAPPPQPEAAPQVNTSALKLTGITTLLGKRAMFILQDPKTNRVSDLVREGERDRFITNLEVLTIDEKAGTVKVIFGGNEMTLDFANNGIRPPTNMMVATAGAAGSLARPGMPTPVPGNVQPFGGAPGAVTVPPPLSSGSASFNSGGQTGMRNVPTRPSRLGNLGGTIPAGQGTAGGDVVNTAPALSPEQQIVVMREQHRLAAQQNIELPPAPPAPGLEGLQGGSLAPPSLPGNPPAGYQPGGPPQFPGPPGLPGVP